MGVGGGAEKKDGGRAGRPRAKCGPKNAASNDDSAEKFGFKKLGDEIRDGHGSPAEKIEHAVLAETANVAAGLQQIPEILGCRLVDRGRRDGSELRNESGGGRERVGKMPIFRSVLSGEVADGSGGPGGVVVEMERPAVGSGSEDARVRRKNFTAEIFELEVERNVGTKRAERVCESGGAEAGMKFLGDGAAAGHFAAFKDDRLEAAFGEIESRDERVVAAADENDALSEGHGQLTTFDMET
jgi:hypothetical protein